MTETEMRRLTDLLLAASLFVAMILCLWVASRGEP